MTRMVVDKSTDKAELHSICLLPQYKLIETALTKYELVALKSHIYLTNRFHAAVRLFSNRSQMASKCDKNKKVPQKAIAECLTDVLTTFWHLWSIRELKHARFWDEDGKRKWAIFTFNLASHNHIHIAKYVFSIRDG